MYGGVNGINYGYKNSNTIVFINVTIAKILVLLVIVTFLCAVIQTMAMGLKTIDIAEVF